MYVDALEIVACTVNLASAAVDAVTLIDLVAADYSRNFAALVVAAAAAVAVVEI